MHHISTTTMTIATKPGWVCNKVLARSHDKLNALYLHYNNDYGHQTWCSGYVQWGTSFHKVRRTIDQMVLEIHVKNYGNKRGTLVTYHEWLSHKVWEPFKRVVFWEHVTNQKCFPPPLQCLKPPKLSACGPRVRGSKPWINMII